MLDFLDAKTIGLVLHIFGAILGAGGAFASDLTFLSSIKDGVINKTEMRFIKSSSKMVWFGLSLLTLSGGYLFYLAPEYYLASSKFLTKMVIVFIIFFNGLFFHFFHIPLLEKSVGQSLASMGLFKRRSKFILISGAVSITSWVTVVILGTLRHVPYNFLQLIGVYLILAFSASLIALSLRKRLLHC